MHEALYYRTLDQYLTAASSFVREGIDRGEPILVAVPEPRLSLLRASLGQTDVRFVDMADLGRNPNRILPWVLRPFVEEHRSQRVRIIGEPVFVGRLPDEIGPCIQHEALINIAFDGAPVSILCPYDVDKLPDMVAFAGHTHPVVIEPDGRRRPGEYRDPVSVIADHNVPLIEPPDVDDALVFDVARLPDLRRVVTKHAGDAGIAPDRIGDVELAVTEIATNALTHGGPGIATLRAWSDPVRIVYEIRGAGKIADPLAGRIVPPPDAASGRGLLVANRLCDLIQTHTIPSGTVTRLHFHL